MKKIRGKVMIVVIGLLLSSLLNLGKVFADFEGMNSVMTISPPQQRIVLTPGEDYEAYISVSSSTVAKYDLVYSVTVGSLSYTKDEQGNTDYNDTDVDTITSYNQMMDWIELEKTSGTVARGKTDTIPFVIHVPENAPAGGQYATIIVQDDTEPDDGEGQGNVSIISKVRFAAGIFAEVTGETIKKGLIKENDVPGFLLSGELSASSLVRNDGNVHTDAEYVLQVWPLLSDEEICTNEEKPETSMVMPGTEKYHVQTCNLPKLGIFKAKQKVSIFGETSEVERTIIVCPLWLLFLILFGIFAAIIWLFAKAKARKKS